jgi:acyl dehydratase
MRIVHLLLTAALTLGVGAAAHAQPSSFLMAACDSDTVTLADITLPSSALADGKILPAGRYELRLTSQHPPAPPGATATSEVWVQFMRDQTLAGREVASVVSASEIADVAEGPVPGPGQSRIELLRGGVYVRIWVNRDGVNYILNLPLAAQ